MTMSFLQRYYNTLSLYRSSQNSFVLLFDQEDRNRRSKSSENEWCTVLRIDLADFLLSVDIRLINGFNHSASAVITAGAEFAVYTAKAPQSLMNDLLTLLARSILDQNRFLYIHTLSFKLKPLLSSPREKALRTTLHIHPSWENTIPRLFTF